MYDKCVQMLKDRGVTLDDIAECVMYLQKQHHPEITHETCVLNIETVIAKREVQHAILTGLQLDILADQGSVLDEQLQSILMDDFSLYGIDEVLAYGICNLYGSIALTNYGFIDREKPCIIGKLNEKGQQCNTFLDDIVGAIAAAAASKIAHNA